MLRMIVALAACLAQEAHPLSQQMKVLEQDLESPDYKAVLATMISTDLAAEWQRVAAPGNYHVFAKQHGGLEAVERDAVLKEAYERRKKIAARYLDLMRSAMTAKKVKPPFDDEAVLIRALERPDKKGELTGPPAPAILPILPTPESGKQWPIYRGPTGRGIVIDTRFPMKWSATENVLWKSRLPGRGNSSPVVWGDRLFVTAEGPPEEGSKAPSRLLLCHDRGDGKLLWQHAAPAAVVQETLYWKNTYASSTPVTDGERVFAFFGNSGLVCCDFEGRRLWHRDLGTFPTMHGPGASPVLYKDLVILIQDQNKGKSLCAAFDKKTGEERWRRERKNAMCWASPVLLRIGERDELVFNGSHEVISYDPATGDVLWKAAGPSQEAIPMIEAGGGLLYSVSGRNGPMFAIRPGGSGDVTGTHVVWRNERGGPHVTSPAYHGGRLYVVSDTGILSCFDAATGATLYQQRLRGRFSASPLVIGDLLLLLNEDGIATIIKSAPAFEKVAENDLGEGTLATPPVLDGRLYFRTAAHLICVGEKR